MSQSMFTRPVEGGAAISWMIHAAKGTPNSGDFFNASEINMVRDLFDRAYADNGYDMVRDLTYRIREGGALVSWMNATAHADGYADGGEVSRIQDFFRSAHQEFGYGLIRDLEDRIYEGEITRDALRRIAPGYF